MIFKVAKVAVGVLIIESDYMSEGKALIYFMSKDEDICMNYYCTLWIKGAIIVQ